MRGHVEEGVGKLVVTAAAISKFVRCVLQCVLCDIISLHDLRFRLALLMIVIL
jgi:hypothetical protein